MSEAVAELSQIPMSQNLAATLARASDAARASGTGEVALEHVLLALCDDPDAQAVLAASQVEIAQLKADTLGFLRSLPVTAPGAPLVVSGPLTRILEAAAAAARGGRRRDINGAIVLAAIVGDGRSTAAQILQTRGLTFDEAIRALQAALAQSSRDSLPGMRPPGADDVLAKARERVQSRSAPSLRDIMNDRPKAKALPPPDAQATPAPAEEAPPAQAGDRETAEVPETDETGEQAAAEMAAGEEISEPVRQRAPEPTGPPPQKPAPVQPPQVERAQQPQRPPNVDLARPVPIATPPPIPPPIPMSPPGARPPGVGAGHPPPLAGQPRGPRSPFPPPQGYAQRPPPALPQPGGFAPPSPSPLPPTPPRSSPPPGNMGQLSAPPRPQGHGRAAQATPKPSRNTKSVTEIGQLAENIPRRMRVGVTERVEVRLAKAAARAVAEGLEGSGQVWVHQVTVAKAMSVRLRAPEGGIFIETASPETQWIENNLGFDSDDFASWRFLVTPQSRGWTRLQIIVSARTIGADGMAAETALPDQIVEVKVKANYKRVFMRGAGWMLAAIIGGALAKFGEGGLVVLSGAMQKFIH